MSLRQMPFFPADFFADTEDMTPEAAKAYLFLLGHAWIRGAKLPNNDSALARLARLSPRGWAAIKSEVMVHWQLGEDNHWRQQRLQKEWEYVSATLERKREAGSLGGRAKAQRSRVSRQTDSEISRVCEHEMPIENAREINVSAVAGATVVPLHARASSLTPALQEEDSDVGDSSLSSEHDSQNPAPNGAGHTERHVYKFAEFWACWDIPGTKIEKADAEKRYRAVIKSDAATHEELCAGVQRYMALCRKERRDVRYIKGPAVWLNKGCWTDELPGLSGGATSDRRREINPVFTL